MLISRYHIPHTKLTQLAQQYLVYMMSTSDMNEYKELKKRLLDYPYCRLHDKAFNKKYEQQPNDFMNGTILQDTVAYSALKQYNSKILGQCYMFLFNPNTNTNMNTNANNNNNNNNNSTTNSESNKDSNINSNGNVEVHMKGGDIFVKYFSGRLPDFMDRLQKSTNKQQIQYILKTLYYIQYFSPLTLQPYLQHPSLTSLMSPKTSHSLPLSQKVYLLQLYKNKDNSQHLNDIQNFYKEYQKAEQKDKLEIVKVQNTMPAKLVNECVKVVSDHVREIDDWTVYRVLENVFEIEGEEVKELVNRLTEWYLNDMQEQKATYNIPTILKILKIRSKLCLDNQILKNSILKNPKKFKNIFFKPNIKKQPFLDAVATKDPKRYLPQQIKIQFVQYVLSTFKYFTTAHQCHTQHIIQLVKLTLKYYKNFSIRNLNDIASMLVDDLIPSFQHQKQTGFFLLNLLIRIDKKYLTQQPILSSFTQIKQQYIAQHKNSQKPQQRLQSLQHVVQINYHLTRSAYQPYQQQNQLKQPDLNFDPKQILQFNYRQIKTFQTVIYLCYVVSKVPLSREQKYSVLKNICHNLVTLMNNYSLRGLENIFQVLTFVESSKCQQSLYDKSMGYLYTALQKSIMNMIRTKKSRLSYHEIRYIKKVFSSNRIAKQEAKKTIPNIQFMKFLQSYEKDPENTQKHLELYYLSKNKKKY